ncbi:WAT1-related protein At1g68170-like [Vicia villosa]|uniref:WAT1-related protein At1g68170-like n=1 Tax=Vicia villosa TaxID=3911 RepID=UPI00273ABE35|nr:WAT1-related protein At1g68170-like [Vicia villosa]
MVLLLLIIWCVKHWKKTKINLSLLLKNMVNLFSVEAIESAKPIVLMIVVQSIYAVVNIMLKMVTNDGSSLSILIVYRFVFSTAFTVPLVFFFERKSVQNLTGKVLFQAFLCGLFGGSLQQNLYIKSLALVSATYTITMLNLIPAITYVLAVSLRMEKPNLGTPAGKAKLMGTLSGICGAMILTLYEGKRLFNLSLHIDLLQDVTSTTHHSPAGSHVWGLMLALGTALSFSLWFITQSKMSENFPWHYSIAALTSIMGTIQSFIFAVCTERDWSQWKLDWNLRLLTAASAGILASGVCFVLLAWCVGMKGPLYVSAFNPLMLVLVAFISSFVLNEYITVGSLTGAALIVCGLYMLLWGKSKEARKMHNMNEIASAIDTVKCDSFHIANNSALSCIQKEHDKKIATIAPDVSLNVNNNTLGEIQKSNI